VPDTAPSRSLNLSGATNFRDLGGYLGVDGRPVRWRRLFRSDNLAGLSARDLAVLAELGLSRAFDFRGDHERAEASYTLPGVVQHSLSIEPTVVQNLRALMNTGQRLTEPDAIALMQQTYRAFVHENASRFGELFTHLLDNDAPLVFHCTAGKDRTGFAAALILLALGVGRPVVMDDFLLTNSLYRRAGPRLQTDVPLEVMDVIWKVRGEFLDAALHVVDADYGGVDNYLARIGVRESQRRRLAELYLQA
jgi:protein-tyrosine phosphatase